MKTLYLMVGPPGSGKSTWVKEYADGWEALGHTVHIVSRDAIRFAMLKECEGYFDKENEVFVRFVKEIADSLRRNEITFADATHLTEKARNKVLDKLELQGVDIIPVFVCPSLHTCLSQNSNRTDRAYVPESAVARMYAQCVAPTFKEKYKYTDILKVRFDTDG